MYYVARDEAGRICEAHTTPQGAAREERPDNDAEVLQFIHDRWRQNELYQLDLDFVRATEDLIGLLIDKGVILFTDLPAKVQEKLLRRREVRDQKHYAGRIGSGDDIIPL